MKKLIAAIVMSSLLFMALATGAFAKSGNGGGNQKMNGKDTSKCTAFDYYYLDQTWCG